MNSVPEHDGDTVHYRQTALSACGMPIAVHIKILRSQLEADMVQVIQNVLDREMERMFAEFGHSHWHPKRRLLGETRMRASWGVKSDTTQASNSNTQWLGRRQ